MKKLIALSCAALLLTACAVPAFAEDEDEEIRVVDPEELQQIVEECLEENYATKENVGVGFVYTATGEEWYYNGDYWTVGASLFKLPMMMLIENDVYNGVIDREDNNLACNLPDAEYLILELSFNGISYKMLDYFGKYSDYRERCRVLAGLSEDELPKKFYTENLVSARYMNGILKALYAAPEEYPHVLEHMLLAQPDTYLHYFLKDKYEIAQKYGSYENHDHIAGIIYTPTPIMVSVITTWISTPEKLIGDIGQRLADYSLVLDERYAKLQAEKEAEKAAQEEAQRAREEAEKAAAAAEKEAELAKASETAAEAAPVEAKAVNKPVFLSSALCGVAAAAALSVLNRRRNRRK